MLRAMFHRTRNTPDLSLSSPVRPGGGSTTSASGSGRRSASDRPGRRGHASQRAAAPSGRWWMGALTGAATAFAVCGTWSVLVKRGGLAQRVVPASQEFPDFVEVPDEVAAKKDGQKDKKERCPVFNGVTGEITVPSENPPKKVKGFIRPDTPYPIQSKEWKRRVVTARKAKSSTTKGASADKIGRRALMNRFLPSTERANGILEKKEGEENEEEEENSGKIPAGNRGGIAAVLTLLVDSKEATYNGVLGGGWGIDNTLYGEGWVGTGPVMWEEIVVCEGQGYRGGSQGGEDGEAAWREASEGGAVKLADCGKSTDADGDEQRTRGELDLACAASDATSAEWMWIPGPTIAAAVPEGAGATAVAELYRLASRSGVSGVYGLMGWVRSVPRPSDIDWSGGKAKWEWVAGGSHGDGGKKRSPVVADAVAEVDALTDGILVRGDHFRHACALVRGVGVDVEPRSSNHEATRRRILTEERAEEEVEGGDDVVGEEQQDEQRQQQGNSGGLTLGVENATQQSSLEPASVTSKRRGIDRELEMSAVSYLLRRTLGVRSYVARGAGGEALSTALGGDQKSRGIWSWVWGGSPAIKLVSSQASVPGSERLPTDCLIASGKEPVLLTVTSMDGLDALKPLLSGFHDSGVYDPYVVLTDPSLRQALSEGVLQQKLHEMAVDQFGRTSEKNGKKTDSSKDREDDVMVMRYGLCGTVKAITPPKVDLDDVIAVNSGKREGTQTARASSRRYSSSMNADRYPESQGDGRKGGVQQGMWAMLLRRFSPVAVVAVGGTGGGGKDYGDSEGETAARRACEQAQAPTAFIRIPADDAAHSVWLARLTPEALASWARPRFSVSIITNDRPYSLQRLLESLLRSRLFGEQLAVDIYVESSADDTTLKIVEAFPRFWGNRGPVQTHFRVLKGGLIRAVTESFYPADRHHHGVLLEDDIEVSPHFFAWTEFTTLTYQYGAPEDFARDMYGVSLYTPRVNEIYKKRYTYDSNQVIAKKTNGEWFSPYLHQTPCSWGAVYFPESWMEYRLYLGAWLREDHVSVNIPESKTNGWKISWKHFYIEMAYQGVYFMLYPNYFNQTSFATNWLEAGEHIKEVPLDADGDTKEGREESEPIPAATPKGDKTHRPEDYTVPLMEDRESLVDPLPRGRLPSLRKLPRMNVLNKDV